MTDNLPKPRFLHDALLVVRRWMIAAAMIAALVADLRGDIASAQLCALIAIAIGVMP